MKSKKGFTLIELLAVVIIIGLLVLIAFPAISKYLIDTENDTYSLHEAELKSATANMMSQCIQGNVEDCVPDNGESRTVYLNELIAQKYSTPIKDPANSDNMCSASDTYVVVTNSTNNVVNLEYQVCLVCSEYKSAICETVKPNDTCNKETDPERPVCGTAVGASTVWTNADRIVSIGCSDTGCGCTQGTFYKRFDENAKQGVITVVDKAGNYTDCVVDVYVDKEVPTCSLTVEGNLGENGWYGGSAPVVKLTYNNADISGIATYGMGVSSRNPDLNKKTSYTVSAGITTVYGYVKDNAGNIGMCSVPVQYDPVVPTGEITYGYQVYPKSDIATVDGRNIKLNSFISEYGNVLGANIYLKSNTSGMSVTIYKGSTEIAKRTISAGVKFMKFSFTGNYNGLTIDMGNASNIALIERIELITDQTNGYYTNKDVIVYATSKDSFSGKGYYSFDGSAWQTSNSYTYGSNVVSSNAKIKDFAGNESDPITFDITNIDKEVPSCYITTEFAPDGKNNWFVSNFDLEVHPSDEGVSNVRDHNITTNSSPSYTTILKGRQTTDTKLTTWHGYVRDRAGNVNRCAIDVKLDKVNPTCEVRKPTPDGENGWYISDVVVDYTTYDETSGIEFKGMNVTGIRDHNNVTQMNLNYETKTENFYCYVEDESGRTNQHSQPYKLDKKDPTCVITPDREIDGENGWYIKDVKLTFATSSDISPITGYDFIDSTSFNYSNKRTTHTITSSTKGVTYHGYAKEESGRTSKCELHVKMDEDKPTCSFDVPPADGENGWYVSSIKFTLKPEDPISGIKNKGIVGSNSKDYNGKDSYTHTSDSDSIMYWGFVEDDAGNENVCDSSPARKKDSTKPDPCTLTVTSGTLGKNQWYTSNVTFGISTTINDNLSKIQGYDIVAGTASPSYGDKHSSFTVTANSATTSGTDHTAYIKDYAGNVTTCAINIKKDSEAPRCTFTKTGTYGLNGWYKSAVRFNLKVFDNTGNSYSYMNRYGVTTSSSTTYNSSTSYYQGSDTNGVRAYCYVEDLAGNTGYNYSDVKIDTYIDDCTLKVTSGTLGNNGWYTNSPTISFVDSNGNAITPNDSRSGINHYTILNDSTASFNFDRKTFTVYSNTPTSGRIYYGHIQDKAGNTTRCSITIKRDVTAPYCSIYISSGTEGDNGWYRSTVGITGKPTREYNSGLTAFDVNASSSGSYGETYSSSNSSKTVYHSSDTTGTRYYCHTKDKAGNTRTTTGPLVKKDTVKPSCEIRSKSNFSGWNTGTQSYKPAWGAVQVSLYNKDGATSWGMNMGSSSAVYNGMTKMSIQMATNTFYGFTKDDAGNTSSCSATVTHSFLFGGSTCSLSFSGTKGSNGWYTSSGRVTINRDDAADFDWTVNDVDQGDVSSVWLSGEGTYYVQARNTGFLKDIGCSIMVNIDKTAPSNFDVEPSKTSSLSNPSDTYLYAILSATDNISGIAKWGYYNGGWNYRYSSTSPYNWYFFGEKDHSGSFMVCDGAGNCTSTQYETFVIDYCDEALNESNAGAWSGCSTSCGTGTRNRTHTWTGTSGATCTYVEEDDCYDTSTCTNLWTICGKGGMTLFGSSIGSNGGVINYGRFDSYIKPEADEFLCSCGEYTTSGYDRICSNEAACGAYFGKTAYDMFRDNPGACNGFDRYWCTCNNPGFEIATYSENGHLIHVYNPFYGG